MSEAGWACWDHGRWLAHRIKPLPTRALHLSQLSAPQATWGLQILSLPCRSYRARRRSDGREVALKVTDMGRPTPWSRRAAVREAHVLAALPHPCLTSYREAFALGSRLCVATETARGGDLRRLLE